jgi:hypothetical protein
VRSLKGWIGNVKISSLNPLQKALVQSQQARPHPDPGLLTAYAEDTLISRERKDLLEHLAVCAECREVLSISTAASADLPGEVRPYALPRPNHPPLRSWLPWIAVAASVVVFCSTVLIHQQRKSVLTPPQVASVGNKEMDQRPAQTPLPEISVVPKTKSSKSALGPIQKSVTTALRSAENSSVASSGRGGVGRSSGQNRADQPSSSQIESATESVKVQGSVSVRSTPAFSGALPSPTASGALSAQGVRPHWRINDAGQVERSFGDGAWQAVFTNERSKMRVVSVFNSDVWVGGEDLRLYHSADNGTTWNAVTLPNKDGREHAIAHIRFQTQQAGAVDAEDGTSWTTTDGGRTWN